MKRFQHELQSAMGSPFMKKTEKIWQISHLEQQYTCRQNLNIYLHYPIPVVSCGYSEESQEGHTKVPERGMPSQPLAGVCVITLCGTKHSRETPTPTPFPPLPSAREDSPRSPNSSTPRAANMKNNNMKRRPRFPT